MLLTIPEWHDSLPMFERIYWYLAIPFSILFLFQTVSSMFGGDIDDIDTDIDTDLGDDGIGFQFLSVKNLIAFFTIFSWAGIASIHSNFGVITTIIISTICGVVMMFIMAYIAYSLSKLAEDGTWKIRNSIYKTGTVYLTIPSEMKGTGKVQIDVQGLKTLDAMTNDLEDIKTGAIVTVVDVTDSEILLVSKSY